jgi:hypothetical protein
VHPGRYRVRLSVDGSAYERTLDVRMDPRVSIAEADLQAQTALSMASYRGHGRAQALREAIDAALTHSGAEAGRRAALQALRGEGVPGDADVMYGSISAAPGAAETIVGLQEKFLHMLNLLQAADARPTTQAREAVAALEQSLAALEARWAALR